VAGFALEVVEGSGVAGLDGGPDCVGRLLPVLGGLGVVLLGGLGGVGQGRGVEQGDRLGDAEGGVEVVDRGADLSFCLNHQLGAALGGGLGFKGDERCVDLFGGAELLGLAAEACFSGGVA